jgi:hypothetical protein
MNQTTTSPAADEAINQQAEPASNAFLITLADIANGALVAEGSEALKEIHDRLTDTPGKAILTLKIGFKSDGRGQVALAYEVTTKAPKPATPISLAYLSGDGRFLRNDPKQRELPFIRKVEPEAKPKIHQAV